ncbi:MAG: hypothetical protein ACE37I_05770 [Rubinisphaera brasiliensis]|uniref:hypothetical protein n=1 Tax=Rubinisphaera brasiliensis TaxID=119 RepID=UPI00391915F7
MDNPQPAKPEDEDTFASSSDAESGELEDDESGEVDLSVGIGVAPSRDRFKVVRWLLLIYNLGLLWFLYNRPEYAQYRPVPVSPWLIAFSSVVSVVTAGLAQLLTGPLIAITLAGMAGLLTSYAGMDGPYCTVLGLTLGITTVLIMIELRRQSSDE